METTSLENFTTGLVFGFDLGTASIGYAVRKGDQFLDVGVILCPEDLGELVDRRGLRRQRRTLRSRKQRRLWFAGELASVLGLTLHGKTGLPLSAWQPGAHGSGWELRAGFASLGNPVSLRVRGLDGGRLSAEELHTPLAHLAKRRGYLENVPWSTAGEADEADGEKKPKGKKKADSEAEGGDEDEDKDDPAATLARVELLRGVMKDFAAWFKPRRGREAHPADILAHEEKAHRLWVEAQKSGRPISELWEEEEMFGSPPDREPRQRKKVWPRNLLEGESRALCAAQRNHFPTITEEKVNWLLFGAAAEYLNKADGALHHVIRRGRSEASKNPGLYSLRWPRFDNRHPGLDLLTPFDTEGRPIYVARKNKPEAKAALFEQAILNFRVIEKATGKKVTPDGPAIARLREVYESSRRKKAKAGKTGTTHDDDGGPVSVEISSGVLKKWYAEFANRYQEIEYTNELKASLGTGRAKFCRANLRKLHEDFVSIANGDMAQASVQPLLRGEQETKQQAKDRFFSDIRHRLVQHRIRLFTRLLVDLIQKHGKPQYIVYEAVRTLALSRKKKEELSLERQKKEKERQRSIEDLRDNSRFTSKKAILRHQLFHETGGKCPFCLGAMRASDLHNGELDLAHLSRGRGRRVTRCGT